MHLTCKSNIDSYLYDNNQIHFIDNVIEEKKVLRRTVVFLLPTKRRFKGRHLLRPFIRLRLDERVVGIIIIQRIQSIANTKIHL